MIQSINRRRFLRSTTAVAVGGILLPQLARAQQPAPNAPPAASNPPRKPPVLDRTDVRAVVGESHRSLENVARLVEATPLLVNACWDWGGGDFETPLQAAAHTGGKAIAGYLLEKGARLDIYAAAMLGQLDFVKAAFTLDPRAHEIPGPHGFTLFHCAKAGGDGSLHVVEWLLSNGVPEVTSRPLPYVWPRGSAPT